MNKLLTIKYFMDQIPGRAVSSFLSYMSFDSGSNQYIINNTGKKNSSGNYLITGEILPSINNFWQTSGIASFKDNYIKIASNNAINFSNLTFITVIENTGSISGAALFSSIQTGSKISYDQYGVAYDETYYKGWEFGLTANNRLYFEYKDKNGIKNFVSKYNLPDKSPIYFQIASKNLSFGYFDYFSSTLKTTSYNIDNKYIFDPNTLYIGYNPESSGLYNFNKPFWGKMEQLLLFSPSIYQYELENIFSGFVCNYIPRSSYFNEYIISGVTGFSTGINGEEIPIIGPIVGITGYTTGIIGYITEITGVESVFTGIYQDDFGNSFEGFQDVFLSGTFEETGFIPLSGYLIQKESGIIPAEINVNLNEIYDYGRSSINLLSKIDNDDLVDLGLLTGNKFGFKYSKNFKSYFDSVNTTFVFDKIRFDKQNKNYILFVNGQLVNSGSNKKIGSLYQPSSYIIYEDYTEPFRGEILFQNDFKIYDNIFGDFISGEAVVVDEFIPFHQNLAYIIDRPDIQFENYNLFINGQKLCSGAHYNIDGNVIYFNVNSAIFSGISGRLTLVSLNHDYNLTGSQKNLFHTERKYFEEYSQVYKNGIRQQNYGDYLEISKLNILSGKAIFDTRPNLIYNNNTLF
jgi:hypothetical protein